MTRGVQGIWRWLAIGMLAMLAACQTVPDKAGFSAQQAAALEQAGFHKEGDNYELGLDNRVLFAFDSSDLKPDVNSMLHRLAGNLLAVGIGGAAVEGHTDSTGQTAYNQSLSEDRANSVKRALVDGGMPGGKVRSYGMGESDPIASNATEDGRRQNRRVVIVVTPADAIAL